MNTITVVNTIKEAIGEHYIVSSMQCAANGLKSTKITMNPKDDLDFHTFCSSIDMVQGVIEHLPEYQMKADIDGITIYRINN